MTEGRDGTVSEIDDQIRRVAATMLRGGLWPALAVGAVAVVVGGIVRGGGGAVGAVIGVVIALATGALTPAVMRWTAAAEPVVVMSAALFSFVAKFGVLLVVFLLLRDATAFDTDALAFALLATALVWTTGEAVAFARARIATVSPTPSAPRG